MSQSKLALLFDKLKVLGTKTFVVVKCLTNVHLAYRVLLGNDICCFCLYILRLERMMEKDGMISFHYTSKTAAEIKTQRTLSSIERRQMNQRKA